MPPRSGRGTRGGFGTGTSPRGRGGGKPVPQPQLQAQNRNQWTQQAARQHRVFQPGQRHMELIASVSRSSGLEKDGDALRDPKIQEEYRAFIQGKVDEYWKKYPLRSHRERASGHEGADADAGKEADSDVDADADARRNRMEMEENLLILFRKLREGLLSIHRRDAFALEVFETSLHLSVLFKSPVQTTSALSHLFPDLYVNIRPSASTSTSTPPSTSTPSPSPSSNSPPAAGTPAPTSSTQTQQSDPRPATQSSAPQGNPNSPLSPAPAPAPAPTPIQIPVVVPRSALASTLVLLLHHLAQSYPSQIAFHTQLRQLHPALQDVLRAPPVPPPHPHPPSPSPSPAPRPSGLPSAAPWLPSAPEYEPQQAAPSPQSDTSRTSSPSTGAGLGPGSHKIDAIASSAQEWVRELARCLRARNYARLEALTRREAYAVFVSQAQAQVQSQSNHPKRKTQTHAQTRTNGESDGIANGASAPGAETGTHTPTPIPISESVRGSESLALEALGTLVETLLDKARGTTWAVLRSAYREVSLRVVPVAPADKSGTTGAWLARSLVLRGGGDDVETAERWLDGRRARGEARRKEGEGMEGRWVLVKA